MRGSRQVMMTGLHDKKELEKFTKFLVYKAVQVIVQSRLGDRVVTDSKPSSSGADWFNLGIRDIPGVLQETKRTFTGQHLAPGKSFCVEISLKTAEDESMTLETWYISMTSSLHPSRASYTVYNRMGLLLKSLFCVSRITPAYRLSRKQGPESFVICYRVYVGEPLFNTLGSEYQRIRVGALSTPAGQITVGGACRTKLLISPHSSSNLATELKDDHFDTSPKRCSTPKPCQVNRNSPLSTEVSALCEESQDLCTTSFSTSPYETIYGGTPSASPGHSDQTSLQRRKSTDSIDGQLSERTKKVQHGAFAPTRTPDRLSDNEDPLPFASLLKPKVKTVEKQAHEDDTDTRDVGLEIKLSEADTASEDQDFVLIELKTPFAGNDGSDIGQFYKDCQGAPALSMFEDQVSVEETLNDITRQLALYEATLPEIDEFVDSLQTPES